MSQDPRLSKESRPVMNLRETQPYPSELFNKMCKNVEEINGSV